MFSLLPTQLIDQTPACLANCWKLQVALNSFTGAIHRPIDGARGTASLGLFVAGTRSAAVMGGCNSATPKTTVETSALSRGQR